MCRPTSFEPVKEMKRIWGCATIESPISPPEPGTKFTTPAGTPTSSQQRRRTSAATIAESLEGLRTTVLPVTIAAAVIPAMIASAKFHGGMTAPTPSGM